MRHYAQERFVLASTLKISNCCKYFCSCSCCSQFWNLCASHFSRTARLCLGFLFSVVAAWCVADGRTWRFQRTQIIRPSSIGAVVRRTREGTEAFSQPSRSRRPSSSLVDPSSRGSRFWSLGAERSKRWVQQCLQRGSVVWKLSEPKPKPNEFWRRYPTDRRIDGCPESCCPVGRRSGSHQLATEKVSGETSLQQVELLIQEQHWRFVCLFQHPVQVPTEMALVPLPGQRLRWCPIWSTRQTRNVPEWTVGSEVVQVRWCQIRVQWREVGRSQEPRSSEAVQGQFVGLWRPDVRCHQLSTNTERRSCQWAGLWRGG